jgi:hypothetical protein
MKGLKKDELDVSQTMTQARRTTKHSIEEYYSKLIMELNCVEDGRGKGGWQEKKSDDERNNHYNLRRETA